MDTPEEPSSNSTKKRRIPKACTTCRTSKLRCDGGKPCLRCREKNLWCDYVRPVAESDLVAEKLARLEAELTLLRDSQPHQPQGQAYTQVQSPNTASSTATALTLLQMQAQGQAASAPESLHLPPLAGTQTPRLASHELYQTFLSRPTDTAQVSSAHQTMAFAMPTAPATQGSSIRSLPSFDMITGQPNKKRKRAEFELNIEEGGDVVSKGLISYEHAELYFQTFFNGCDRYVPIFDPSYDTFLSIRSRSSMLFDVICAVGCRAEHGPTAPTTPPHHNLLSMLKSPLCAVILGTAPKIIETIQALLISACYSEKGWLLTSMALKMALDIGLDGAWGQLSGLVLAGGGGGEVRLRKEEEEKLMRESRVWFGVWVLEHILSIDCGKIPGVRATSGEAIRRCRILLRHPARTALDFRLLAQVELNSIRALAHERLTPRPGQEGGLSDDEMTEIVQGTRIDLSVWLSDWENLVKSHVQSPEERASLIINLKIQRDWSEMTMLCKGLQGLGIENVAIMSDPQRNLLHLAKTSAKRHLSTIVSDPTLYLATFRYGMDFVWAKCAFSVLLLLKLARIEPDSLSPQSEMTSLIADAKLLMFHLAKIRGSGNIYLRILALSVEKCEKALNTDSISGTGSLGVQSTRPDDIENEDDEGVDPEMDFQSYVPREFTLEWNFPGLNFCWIPCDWMDFFADFGTGF